jgi:Integrase core domain
MGAVGSAYDNALMESFWGRMQVDLFNRRKWKTRIELAGAIHDYIELWHNPRRRHSALGMRTPIETEAAWLDNASRPAAATGPAATHAAAIACARLRRAPQPQPNSSASSTPPTQASQSPTTTTKPPDSSNPPPPKPGQITVSTEAGELHMADGEPLLLALDAAESMTPADRGVLRDLAAKSSQGVRLRLGFATFAGEQRTAVDELLASGPECKR